MKTFLKVMKALSDPSRVRTMKLLEERSLCVCELQDLLGLAQSTVSKHMKTLEEAGLVDSERRGTWIIYHRGTGDRSDYAANILKQLPVWLNDDRDLRTMRENLPRAAKIRVNCPK